MGLAGVFGDGTGYISRQNIEAKLAEGYLDNPEVTYMLDKMIKQGVTGDGDLEYFRDPLKNNKLRLKINDSTIKIKKPAWIVLIFRQIPHQLLLFFSPTYRDTLQSTIETAAKVFVAFQQREQVQVETLSQIAEKETALQRFQVQLQAAQDQIDTLAPTKARHDRIERSLKKTLAKKQALEELEDGLPSFGSDVVAMLDISGKRAEAEKLIKIPLTAHENRIKVQKAILSRMSKLQAKLIPLQLELDPYEQMVLNKGQIEASIENIQQEIRGLKGENNPVAAPPPAVDESIHKFQEIQRTFLNHETDFFISLSQQERELFLAILKPDVSSSISFAQLGSSIIKNRLISFAPISGRDNAFKLKLKKGTGTANVFGKEITMNLPPVLNVAFVNGAWQIEGQLTAEKMMMTVDLNGLRVKSVDLKTDAGLIINSFTYIELQDPPFLARSFLEKYKEVPGEQRGMDRPNFHNIILVDNFVRWA